MSQNTNRISLALVSTCIAALAMTACSGPNALPHGYTYLNKPYKSANPPESSKFTELQRTTMGPEQAEQFRMAVYKLVDDLTNRAGMPPKAIFVMKPEPMTPFYANLDNDLRESLRHVGYRLSETPDNSYIFTYKATALTKGKAVEGDMSPNMRIVIYIHDKIGEDGKVLTQEAGDFYIQGADKLNVPFASFPGTFIPEPTASATSGNN